MSWRVFVTGATGYLGGALARRLVADGHHVVALVREESDTAALEALGVELAAGDVTDRLSMREGMAGADWVVHAAAWVELDGPLEAMRRVNVEGSENVASLAYKLGCGRFLSISSVAAFGGSPEDGSLADEESAQLRQPLPSPYSVTKYEGQERIRSWGERGLRLNTVYPGLIYGPPGKRRGTNALLSALVRGRFPFLVGADRKSSWIFLDDVVEALARLMERAEPGRDFFLAGEVVRQRELVRRACAVAGTRPPRLELPVTAVRLLIGVATPLLRLVGKRNPMPPGQLASIARHWAFDDSRARRELDWRPRPLAEGLPPTVEMLTRGRRSDGRSDA